MPLRLNPATCRLDLVSVGGGGGGDVVSLGVDDSTVPGTNPVLPNGAGRINILGAAVANHSIPLETHSRAVNEFNIEIQVASAVTGAPGSIAPAGIVSFDDTMFTVDADGFVQLIGGTTAIDTVTGDDAVPVPGDGAGNINFIGSIVANGTNVKPLYFDGDAGTFTQQLQLQVSTAIASSPVDFSEAGICSFDSDTFDVDAFGFVTLKSGPGPVVDKNRGDDGVQVSPNAAGVFSWVGQTVANATHAKPVFFKDSASPNALDLDVQVAAAITGAPADKNDVGLCSFDDTMFTVDTNGFVQLIGGTLAIDTITGDDAVAVGPDGAGNVNFTGSIVANAANVKPLFFDGNAGTFTEDLQLQVSAAITGAPADTNDAGISSFDDTIFSVDANGFVTLASTGLAETITGDSGGALSPIANNWNILGRSGSKTAGSAATLTVRSPPYQDESGSTTVTLNSGSFATNAITLTVPASAGLADGDMVEFVATNGVLVVQLVGSQVGHLGAAATSAAGTFTGSATGDTLTLRYQSSTDDWWATSATGVWVLA